jgi:hypothetical protein
LVAVSSVNEAAELTIIWIDSIARKIGIMNRQGGSLCSVQGGSTPGGGALVGAQRPTLEYKLKRYNNKRETKNAQDSI